MDGRKKMKWFTLLTIKGIIAVSLDNLKYRIYVWQSVSVLHLSGILVNRYCADDICINVSFLHSR